MSANGGSTWFPKQRIAELMIAIAPLVTLIEWRVGAIERDLEKLEGRIELLRLEASGSNRTLTRIETRLDNSSETLIDHVRKPVHDQGAVQLEGHERRLSTTEDRIKNIAGRVQDVERALPRRGEGP